MRVHIYFNPRSHGQGKFTTKELMYSGEWDSDTYEGQGRLSRYGEMYEGTTLCMSVCGMMDGQMGGWMCGVSKHQGRFEYVIFVGGEGGYT